MRQLWNGLGEVETSAIADVLARVNSQLAAAKLAA